MWLCLARDEEEFRIQSEFTEHGTRARLTSHSRPSRSASLPGILERWNQWLEPHCFLASAALVLITFLLFSGSLSNRFVSDDELQILQNPYVVDAHHWARIFTTTVWAFRGPERRVDFYFEMTGRIPDQVFHGPERREDFYRPLQILSYWLLFRIAGADAALYHLVQLLLYCLTTWLVFRIGRELLASTLAALVGALLWAVHPLHVEVVAWVACWAEIGCTVCFLLGFLLFVRAEKASAGQIARHSLAALAYFPALFFKEAGLSLPLLLLVYWFFRPPQCSWTSRAARFAPYVLAVGAYGVIRRLAVGSFAPLTHPVSPNHTVLAALGLLGGHAKLFFWPVNLSFARTFDLPQSVSSLWPWLSLFVVFTAIAVRKREWRLGFLVLWWMTTLLPALDVRHLSTPLIADRQSYLPSVGLCLAFSCLLLEWLPGFVKLSHARFVIVPAALVFCLWCVQTVRAVPCWRDDNTLLAIALERSPQSALMRVYHASALEAGAGDLDGAAREYELALRLNAESLIPLSPVTYDAYLGLGRVAQFRHQTQLAAGYYGEAAHILPRSGPAYHALGVLYFVQRDYGRSAAYFVQAVRADPLDLIGHFFLGTCWMKLDRFREAANEFGAAAAADPTYREAYEAQARALDAAGDPAAAARVREALRRQQNNNGTP